MVSRRPVRVLFVAENPNGGAGTAAHRLYTALDPRLVDARFLVLTGDRKGTSNWDETRSIETEGRFQRRLAKLSWRMIRQVRAIRKWVHHLWEDRFLGKRQDAFEILTLSQGWAKLETHPWFQWADLIHLHWTAGFLSTRQSWARKRWIVSLHDCFPFTGVCHFPAECLQYQRQCQTCPQLAGSPDPGRVQRYFESKRRGYSSLNSVVVHGPSQWIVDAAAQSRLLSGVRSLVLPNVVPSSIFRALDQQNSRDVLGLPQNKRLALFVSGYVGNRRKGLTYFLELAQKLVSTDWVFVVVGAGDLPVSDVNVMALGTLSDPRLMALAYSASDLFLTSAVQDNYPSTIVEAQLCGTPVIGFAVGGQPEMLVQSQTGFLSDDISVNGLLQGMRWFNETVPDRAMIAHWAFDKWNQKAVTDRWHQFYASLAEGVSP